MANQDYANLPSKSRPLTKRGLGFQKIEIPCAQLLSRIFQTKDFLYSKMAQDWTGIVGPELAYATRPQRIQVFQNEGTLWVEVDPSGSLWVPTYSATLIERVNQYMGYKAVQRIMFRKASLLSPSPSSRPEHPKESSLPYSALPSNKEHMYATYPALREISNDTLCQALAELAQCLQ